ncbi:MAG: ATP-dependent Lon protease, partial [Kiritimatiellia bacterium]
MDTSVAAIPLRGLVLLPGGLRALTIGRATTIKAVEHHLANHSPILAVPQVDPAQESVTVAEMSSVGVLAQITRATRLPEGTLQVLIEGLERVGVVGPLRIEDDMTVATVTPMPEVEHDAIQVAALTQELSKLYHKLLTESGMADQDAKVLTTGPTEPDRLIHQLSSQLDITWTERLA